MIEHCLPEINPADWHEKRLHGENPFFTESPHGWLSQPFSYHEDIALALPKPAVRAYHQ